MKTKRVLSVLLSLVMILSMLPTAVIADETAAADAVVYFTVSNKGLLAADNDGSAMANREVTVTDIDADGKLTYHEALVAAHEAYNTQDGYVTESSDYGTSVTKLWGIDTTNTLFFANNAALTMGVGYDSIKDGDALVASVNKDNTYWADWYTFFDAAEKTVKADREFTLNLKGHLGMAYLEQDLADIPLEGISVGTWNDGEFAAFEGKVTDADGNVTLSFSEPGTYYVTADGTVNDEVTDWANGGATLETDCPIIAPVCVVNVEEAPAPTAITIKHNASDVLSDGRIVCQKGDKFTLTAYDQDGNETPVTWKNTSWGNTFTLDEATGEVEVTGDVYASTSYLYFTATSTLDETVSQQITIQATGFVISEYMKSQTVALSTDGQTAKTASLTGGLSGHNIWSYDIPEGVAQLAAEPGTSNTIKFNVFRPGTINVAFKLDINEELTDYGTITVTGVAVEDSNGIGGKTYLGINADNANPTEQLTAYVADGRTVASWASADETIAAVDENGLVTAKGVGSTIITATDSEGTQGGIKVVVESEEIPYFEALEFMTTALASGAWVKDETFAPTSLTYALPIKSYSTSTLTLQATTLYDTDKYTAVAEYTDINGEKQSVTVNSGKITTLANQPFDDSVMTITIADKNNADNNTVYTFNVSRPRDTTKVIKSNGGIALVPGDRALSGTAYKGIAEGAMQKADESGALTSGTGVSGTHYYYRTFIYDDIESFKLNLAASTAYAHIRYSIDGGSTWTETTQSGGATNAVPVPESGAAEIAEIIVQIIDDATYTANIKAEKDGFADAEPTEYRIWVDRVTLSNPVMLTAEVSVGDWYPAFSSDMYYYWLVVGNKDEAPVLTYTVAEGSTVKIGTAEQTVGDDGKYTVTLGTAQTSITVTSEDSNFTNTYKFGYKKKSALDVPDKVVDYLCIGSQYTNGGYGTFPEATLAGSLKSLGNFGGYITYYYEKPMTDNPNNKYGMDFYVVGNSSETNIDSMAELGQVYVSEDGSTWYALAGSEHYENKAIWDYEITYTKGDDGKAYWTDNYGNSIDYAAKAWPG
ncbi:MAG: Ig-like domain-containing protein, partial [Clostridia bacterium]|nr:Ig-like domain-containing protein [Clostridia bacterium]